MNGGSEGEGDFATGVEDVFLAGFEAWGELGQCGQMQGPFLGNAANQAVGGTGTSGKVVVGTSSSPANGTGMRAPPGIGSMTGLGGSMQSFLGEAGMGYPESTGSGGGDSFKDGFAGGNSASPGNGAGGNSSSSSNNARRQFGGGSGTSGLRDSPCKMEPLEVMEEEDDGCLDSDLDEEHDYDYQQHQHPSDTQDPQDGQGDNDNDDEEGEDGPKMQVTNQRQSSEQGAVRGLGRVFGIQSNHPMIAEAQARAEATVHGKGGRGTESCSAAEAAEKKRKRAVLSKEERAKQNRDRNREHARNTRLRKKAFVEELKNKVEELVETKAREEHERKVESRRESSLRDMRLQILLTFLEYRGRAEMGRPEWQGVLDDDFELRLPVTPYRSFPASQVQGGIRVIKGLDGVLADTASLNVATKAACPTVKANRHDNKSSSTTAFEGKHKADTKGSSGKHKGKRGTTASRASVTSGGTTSSESCSGEEGGFQQALGASLGGKGRGSNSSSLAAAVAAAGVLPSPHRVYYVVDPKEVMVNRNAFMCPFLARSPQLMVPGMLRCTFSTKSNRLSSMQLSFDPTLPARQLARAAMLQGRATPGMAGMMARLLGVGGAGAYPDVDRGFASNCVDAAASHSISNAEMSGVPQQAFAGQEEGVLHSVLEDLLQGRVSSTLVNNPVHGKSYLRVYPLNGDNLGVRHFIGVLENANIRGAQASPTAASPTTSTTVAVTAVTSVTAEAAAAGTATGVLSAPSAIGGVIGVGDVSSSGLEPGTSEGETSSDSTGGCSASSARGRDALSSSSSSSSSKGGNGSGASDDGTGICLMRGLSGATTTAGSDSSGSSGYQYETRRSRRHPKDTSAIAADMITCPATSSAVQMPRASPSTTSNLNSSGSGNGSGRARARAEGGSKRNRLS